MSLLAFGASLFLGNQRQNKVADLQSRRAGLQNEIFAEQFQQKRDNLILQRRQQYRQQAQRLAGSRVAAVASGSARSSSFGTIQNTIRSRTEDNVSNINRAISSGDRLSGLNQQINTLGSRISKESQPGPWETGLGVVGQAGINLALSSIGG